jgi:hypothetical protein
VERPALFAASALVAAALLAGCSKEDDPVLPAACREGPQAVLAALESAPGEVRLAGGESLSDCMREASAAGDVQELGASYIEAAHRLAGRAADEPGGEAELQLGYLLGAARRGTQRNIGAHEETVRRMELELGEVDLDGAAFRRGLSAGREDG